MTSIKWMRHTWTLLINLFFLFCSPDLFSLWKKEIIKVGKLYMINVKINYLIRISKLSARENWARGEFSVKIIFIEYLQDIYLDLHWGCGWEINSIHAATHTHILKVDLNICLVNIIFTLNSPRSENSRSHWIHFLS